MIASKELYNSVRFSIARRRVTCPHTRYRLNRYPLCQTGHFDACWFEHAWDIHRSRFPCPPSHWSQQMTSNCSIHQATGANSWDWYRPTPGEIKPCKHDSDRGIPGYFSIADIPAIFYNKNEGWSCVSSRQISAGSSSASTATNTAHPSSRWHSVSSGKFINIIIWHANGVKARRCCCFWSHSWQLLNSCQLILQ